MEAQEGPNLAWRWLRRIWTFGTLLLALPVLIPVAIFTFLYAALTSIGRKEGWWYGSRLRVMQGVMFVFGKIMRGSTWLFNRLLGRSLYVPSPYDRVHPELLIIGHRGAPMQECENTLPAFEAAIRQGANALEIDLCFTEDGEVVVFHDWDPDSPVALFREAGSEPLQRCKPCFGTGEFRRCVPRLSLEDLRAQCKFRERDDGADLPEGEGHIVTWREFLEAAQAWTSLDMVFLDMKVTPADIQLAGPMIARIQADINDLCPEFECVVMTIYPDVLEALKVAAPDMRFCFDKEFPPLLQDPSPEFIAARSTVAEAIQLRHDIASIGRPTFLTLSPWELYKAVLEHDLLLRHSQPRSPLLITWTINEPDELRWLVNSGVDGIITDHPRYLLELERQRKKIHPFWKLVQTRWLRDKGILSSPSAAPIAADGHTTHWPPQNSTSAPHH